MLPSVAGILSLTEYVFHELLQGVSTAILSVTYRISSELRSQATAGLVSTTVGDHVGIRGAVGSLFFFLGFLLRLLYDAGWRNLSPRLVATVVASWERLWELPRVNCNGGRETQRGTNRYTERHEEGRPLPKRTDVHTL